MSPLWSKTSASENEDMDDSAAKQTITDSVRAKSQGPVFGFEGELYEFNSLEDELKKLVSGIRIADSQVRKARETLNLLMLGRQTMIKQLQEKIKTVAPLPKEES